MMPSTNKIVFQGEVIIPPSSALQSSDLPGASSHLRSFSRSVEIPSKICSVEADEDNPPLMEIPPQLPGRVASPKS